MSAAPSDNRRIVSNRLDRFVGNPDLARPASWIVVCFDPAAEMDVVGDFGPRKFPRVAERQPVFRIFLLPSILDDLAERSGVIRDAIAAGWNSEACHALHETGGEPAEAAVSERSIGLGRAQSIGVDAEIAKRATGDIGQS